MPRVCARLGCGKEIVKADGAPDYRRFFCGPECKKSDHKEKMQTKRQKGRCPTCGRKLVPDASQNACVTGYKGPKGQNQEQGATNTLRSLTANA